MTDETFPAGSPDALAPTIPPPPPTDVPAPTPSDVPAGATTDATPSETPQETPSAPSGPVIPQLPTAADVASAELIGSATGQRVTAKFREYAHDGLAIVGVLGIVLALVVNALMVAGVHLAGTGAADGFGIAGGILAAVSKGIDSANNAAQALASGNVTQPVEQPLRPIQPL